MKKLLAASILMFGFATCGLTGCGGDTTPTVIKPEGTQTFEDAMSAEEKEAYENRNKGGR